MFCLCERCTFQTKVQQISRKRGVLLCLSTLSILHFALSFVRLDEKNVESG